MPDNKKEENGFRSLISNKICKYLLFILFPLILSSAVFAAQDFIVENKTSLLFIVNGTTGNIIMAPSFGMVGIGTASPNAVLDVSGSVLINTSSPSGALNVRNGAGTSALFVNASSGRVGIGATSPNVTFHVSGNANVTGTLSVGTFEISNAGAGMMNVSGQTFLAA